MGYTCVTLWDQRGRRGHSLVCFCFFFKLKERKKEQSSRGRSPAGLSGGHTCVTHSNRVELIKGREVRGSGRECDRDDRTRGLRADSGAAPYSSKTAHGPYDREEHLRRRHVRYAQEFLRGPQRTEVAACRRRIKFSSGT